MLGRTDGTFRRRNINKGEIMKDTDIMGEKEFFDIMKNANRYLTMEERHIVATLVETFIENRKGE